MTTPQVVTAKVLIEAGNESPERTISYVVSALKSACRNIRDGSVSIALYDSHGNLIGADTSGVPSPAHQKHIERLYQAAETGDL